MPLTSDEAEAVVKAAKARAADIGLAVSVVVLDLGGHLKAFSRMDGAWLGSIDVAMKKARTSVLFEMETQKVWELCRPDAQAHVTFAGGIPLKASDGRLLGAIGVSGGQVAQDFEVARAGWGALPL
jgi:uncharacterized protein GlcG (DUF336 family)